MIDLFKYLFLNDPVFPFEGIQQVESDRTIGVVIPDLYQIDSRPVMKEGIICIETLLCPLYFFPVSRIKTKVSA